MKKTKASETINSLINFFTPIVVKDEDIRRFIEENELDDNDKRLVVSWLVPATISMIAIAENYDEVDEICEDCKNICVHCEKELSKKYDDIHTVLVNVLKQNIAEWTEHFKGKFEVNFKNTHSGQQKGIYDWDDLSLEMRRWILFRDSLSKIVIREDDVIELTEKYNYMKANNIIGFVCCLTIFNMCKQIGNGNDAIKAIASVNENALQEYFKIFKKQAEDFDEFMNDVNEVIEDHYNEFSKKLIKQMRANR